MGDVILRHEEVYTAYLESVFHLMDIRDGVKHNIVHLDNFKKFIEETVADERPEGPMRAKDKLREDEMIKICREIAGDQAGSGEPKPFTMDQFKTWCRKYRKEDSDY